MLDFTALHDIEWVTDEVIAVLGAQEAKVFFYNANGALEGTIGNRGEGPGEFGWPVRMFSSGEGELFVADSRPTRITYYADYATPSPIVLGNVPGMPLEILSGTTNEVTVAWFSFSAAATPVVTTLRNRGLETEDHFAISDAVRNTIPIVAGASGAVYVGTDPGRYEIKVFSSSGALLHEYGWPLLGRLPDAEELRRRETQTAEALERTGIDVPQAIREEIQRSFRPAPIPYYHSAGFALDGEERLWVLTTLLGADSDSTRIDIFDLQDDVVQVLARDRARALAIRGEFVAVLVERQNIAIDGLQGLDIYRIERRQ